MTATSTTTITNGLICMPSGVEHIAQMSTTLSAAHSGLHTKCFVCPGVLLCLFIETGLLLASCSLVVVVADCSCCCCTVLPC